MLPGIVGLSGLTRSFVVGSVSIDNDLTVEIGPSPTTASFTFKPDGFYYQEDGLQYSWLVSGTASAYEIRATVLSGTPTGTFGTWLSLTSDRTWSLTAKSPDHPQGVSQAADIRFELRDIANYVVLDTATFSLTARWE